MAAIILFQREMKEGQGAHHHSSPKRNEGPPSFFSKENEERAGWPPCSCLFRKEQEGPGCHHYSFLLERKEERARWPPSFFSSREEGGAK